MNQQISAEHLASRMPEGTMVYSGAMIPPSAQSETVFLIRESKFAMQLWQHKRAVAIQSRAAVFTPDDSKGAAVVIVVCFCIEGNLYETWLNYHQPEGVKHLLACAGKSF